MHGLRSCVRVRASCARCLLACMPVRVCVCPCRWACVCTRVYACLLACVFACETVFALAGRCVRAHVAARQEDEDEAGNLVKKPHNPMINAGAIVCGSLIQKQLVASERFMHTLAAYARFAGAWAMAADPPCLRG